MDSSPPPLIHSVEPPPQLGAFHPPNRHSARINITLPNTFSSRSCTPTTTLGTASLIQQLPARHPHHPARPHTRGSKQMSCQHLKQAIFNACGAGANHMSKTQTTKQKTVSKIRPEFATLAGCRNSRHVSSIRTHDRAQQAAWEAINLRGCAKDFAGRRNQPALRCDDRNRLLSFADDPPADPNR